MAELSMELLAQVIAEIQKTYEDLDGDDPRIIQVAADEAIGELRRRYPELTPDQVEAAIDYWERT